MARKKITTPVWMSCSRNNHGEFRMSIRDDNAVDSSIEIALTAEQFALLISGVVVSELSAEVRRPDLIGKKRIAEDRSIECPLRGDRDDLQQWLLEHAQEDGWEIDAYLGSQGSVKHTENGCVLNYRVKRWVDADV